MEGEVTFFSQAQLDEWRPRPRALVAELHSDVTSPLGQLYAEWNAGNRRAIEDYDRSVAGTERYEKRRGYGTDQAGTTA